MASLKICLRGQVFVGAGTSKSHLAWSTDDRKISKESLSQKNKQTMTVLSPAKLLEDLAHCDARTAFLPALGLKLFPYRLTKFGHSSNRALKA